MKDIEFHTNKDYTTSSIASIKTNNTPKEELLKLIKFKLKSSDKSKVEFMIANKFFLDFYKSQYGEDFKNV